MYQNKNDSQGFIGMLVVVLLTIFCVITLIYFSLNKDSLFNKNKVNEDSVVVDVEDADDSRSILSLVVNSSVDKIKPVNQPSLSTEVDTPKAVSVTKVATTLKTSPLPVKIIFKEFDSSKISAKQFDFYKFKYPNNWYLAFSNANDVALTDSDGVTRDSFKYHAEIGKKPFMVILMSTAENASYSKDTYTMSKTINGKQVAWKLEAAPHLDSSPDDSNLSYVLSYILTTPYTNKQSVYFAVGPITNANKSEFTKIIEQIISSYTVTEGPIGIEHRKLESEGKI